MSERKLRYALMRDAALDDAERAVLIAHVAAQDREPWTGDAYDLRLAPADAADGIVAYGAVARRALVPGDHDFPRMMTALTGLRELLPGTTLTVADGYGGVLWREGVGYVFSPLATEVELAVPANAGEWPSARALAAALPAPVEPVFPPGPLGAALAALASLPTGYELPREACGAVGAALVPASDRDALAEAVLARWRGATTALLRNLASALAPIAGERFVIDETIAELGRAEDPTRYARTQAALALMRESANPHPLAAMFAALRRYRRGPASFAVPREFTEKSIPDLMLSELPRAKGKALPAGDRGPLAAVVLSLASPGSSSSTVSGLTRVGRDEVLTWLRRFPADHAYGGAIGGALDTQVTSAARDPVARDALAAELRRWLGHPRVWVRFQAAKVLARLLGPEAHPVLAGQLAQIWRAGLWNEYRSMYDGAAERELKLARTPADPPLGELIAAGTVPQVEPPPLRDGALDLVSPDPGLRIEAVIRVPPLTLGNNRLFIALALYEQLYFALPERGRFGWPLFDHVDELPAPLRARDARDKRQAFMRTSMAAADIASLPEVLRDVHEFGAAVATARPAAAALMSQFDPPAFELAPDERAQLEATEAAYLARFATASPSR